MYNFQKRSLLTAALLLLIGFTVSAQTVETETALKMLNTWRAASGLAPVSISKSLSAGCLAHARYLFLNKDNPKTGGLDGHKEYLELPGYSKEGETAGQSSVISFGQPLSEAIGGFIGTFYHRVPLLQPNLKEIGLAYENGIALIDCISGVGGPRTADVVLCPGENQTAVPLYLEAEIPQPAPADTTNPGSKGFPITIYFCRFQAIKDVVFSLTDNKKAVVPCYVSTPEKPATDFTQWNTVCAIPKKPLQAGMKYSVTLRCTVDGKPYSKSYSFQTVKN